MIGFKFLKPCFQGNLVEGTSVGTHVLKMTDYVENLERLSFPLDKELANDLILQSLSESFSEFVLDFNMNDLDKNLSELLGILRTAQQNMK